MKLVQFPPWHSGLRIQLQWLRLLQEVQVQFLAGLNGLKVFVLLHAWTKPRLGFRASCDQKKKKRGGGEKLA